MNKIVDGEKRELEQQLREEGDTLEGSFIQAAMQSLIVRNVLYRNKVLELDHSTVFILHLFCQLVEAWILLCRNERKCWLLLWESKKKLKLS